MGFYWCQFQDGGTRQDLKTGVSDNYDIAAYYKVQLLALKALGKNIGRIETREGRPSQQRDQDEKANIGYIDGFRGDSVVLEA